MKNLNVYRKGIPESYLNLPYYLNKYLGRLPDPSLDPGTRKQVTAGALEAIFPKELVRQEFSLENAIPVPAEVLEIYRNYRPSPLIRADRLEKMLDTPAEIYFKYEGVSPVGSHKLNTAVSQAYYNCREGTNTLTTETGAGQWGSALALACRMFGLKCRVFMVQSSYEQKPYRKTVMRLYGADVHSSPSELTESGRRFRRRYPDTGGSLGMAISEAIETAVSLPKSKYALGSVLNHVLLHQTVIGLEAKAEMENRGLSPDVVIGCCGGGSNFAGIAFPFIAGKLAGRNSGMRFIAVEPESCPSLTQGEYRYDSGDTAGYTPLMKIYTVGRDYIPSPIHAGGLRYHGTAPLVAFLYHEKIIEAAAYAQTEIFDAARIFCQAEDIIPAPESAYAVKHAMVEALRARDEGRKKVILFCLSGHGFLDLGGYEKYLNGNLSV